MLSPAALAVADHLATILMVLVRAVAPSAPDRTPDTDRLFHRLSALVIRLIRLGALGPRPPRPLPAAAAARKPSPTAPRAPRPPTRRGWLLAARPDCAPAIADALADLLADPASAELLATAPALARALRPLLRSLGLTQDLTPVQPPPDAPRPTPPAPISGVHPTPRVAEPIAPPLDAATQSLFAAESRPIHYDLLTASPAANAACCAGLAAA